MLASVARCQESASGAVSIPNVDDWRDGAMTGNCVGAFVGSSSQVRSISRGGGWGGRGGEDGENEVL